MAFSYNVSEKMLATAGLWQQPQNARYVGGIWNLCDCWKIHFRVTETGDIIRQVICGPVGVVDQRYVSSEDFTREMAAAREAGEKTDGFARPPF